MRSSPKMSGALAVTAISELVLETNNLDEARHFYGEVLRLEETRHGERREDRRWFLVGDSARLGLWTPQTGLGGGRGGSHVHFALALSEAEMEAVMARLKSEGHEFEGPVQLGPGRSIYLTDPDGNAVELWTQDMTEYSRSARQAEHPDVLPGP